MLMAAEASRRQSMNSLMTLFLLAGLFLLALAGIFVAYARTPGMSPNDQTSYGAVYAPIVWDLGMFLLIFAIWGMAMMRQDMDPIARLLMYLVSFILILLIFVAPNLMFRGVPP